MSTSNWLRGLRATAVLFGVAALGSCGGRSVPSGTDTSSHWLSACDEDDECATGQECLCGVCTRSCNEPRDCRDLDADAVCGAVPECGTPNICTLEEELGSVPCEGGDCSSPSPVDPGSTSVAPGNPTPPAPSGECAFLAELTSENGNCLAQEERCEQFRGENKPRTVLLILDRYTTDSDGNEVSYSEAELAKREACAVEWAIDRQLEVNARSGDVEIKATWAEVAPIAGSVAFMGYEVKCTEDCDYCHGLNEAGCAADYFCVKYSGRVVNHAWLCLEPPMMFECMPADNTCGSAFKFGRDEAGACWLFNNDCYTEQELEYSEEDCGHDDRYIEAFSDEESCEDTFACYSPLENVELAYVEEAVGCECEHESAEACNGDTLFLCHGGRWAAGWDGICSIEYGRCDRVFDTLDECLAAGFDCHVGANEESEPVCAVHWNSSERPTFTEERCEAMGGVVGDYDSNLWINMLDSAQSCLVLSGPTIAQCEAVDGYANCTTEANTIFCENDETPITAVSDCAEGNGYCCVPDAAL